MNEPAKIAELKHPLGNYSQAQNDIKNFDKFESSILLVARFFFQANDEPNSQAWKKAFLVAEKIFPPPFGSSIAHALSLSIDNMCASRIRPFEYYKASAEVKNSAITDEERYFLQTLKFIRKKKQSLARTNALMVSEGPNVEDFMLALKGIVIILGEAKRETNL